MYGVIVAAGLFVVTAMVGLTLLNLILNDKPTIKPVALIHGSLAAIALLILITYVAAGHTGPLILASLGLFVLAALGGLTLFTLDFNKKKIPKIFAVIHPLTAVSGLVTLIIYILQSRYGS